MPIEHVVLFKVRANVTGAELDRLTDGVHTFIQIAGVTSVRFGSHNTKLYADYKDRSKGFTHILSVTLTNASALESYAVSPIHERIRQTCILPIIEDIMCIDYVLEERANTKSAALIGAASAAASVAALPAVADQPISNWLKGGIVVAAITGVAFALKSVLGDGSVAIPVTVKA